MDPTSALDAKVVYWTGALINMAVLTGFALTGVRQARRGDYTRHRRSMLIGIALVLGFIVSYGLKLAFLGREDLSSWSVFAVNALRFHETCVLTMVVAGGLAFSRGRKLARTTLLSDDPNAAAPAPLSIVRHRRAGRVAVIAALLGFVSAGFVLAGMYGRLA